MKFSIELVVLGLVSLPGAIAWGRKRNSIPTYAMRVRVLVKTKHMIQNLAIIPRRTLEAISSPTRRKPTSRTFWATMTMITLLESPLSLMTLRIAMREALPKGGISLMLTIIQKLKTAMSTTSVIAKRTAVLSVPWSI